ncbi:SWF/SNF helicase family protein [Candidatus Fermentibacteria bacterium]|nr:SWF/SNF helicase family protein [Candidatus Fermentibacteria bacterium]
MDRCDAYTKMWLLRLLLVDPNGVIRESKGESLPSPKYDALDRIVGKTVADGCKVVVFTSIKRGVTRELVMRYARFGVCLIDGDVDAFPRKKKESQRETIRREFQFGDTGVLIATLGTMSEGVDLSAASTVVFLDKPFTSTARDQAIKRVHRLGQTKPVEVISIVARDPAIDAVIRDKDTGEHETIDEAIERLIDKKELLIQHVVDGARLSPEERRLLEERENLGRVISSLA